MSDESYTPQMRQMKRKMEKMEKDAKQEMLRKMIRQEVKSILREMKK